MAIPSLTRELHAETSDIQRMTNAYSLVQSGLLLSAGSAADGYGRTKTLISGSPCSASVRWRPDSRAPRAS